MTPKNWEILLRQFKQCFLLKQRTKLIRLIFFTLIISSICLCNSSGDYSVIKSSKNLVNTDRPFLSLGDFTVTNHETLIDIESIDNITIDETITLRNNQNDTDSLNITFSQPNPQNLTYESLIISNYVEGYQLPFVFVNDTNLISIDLLSQLNTSEEITILLSYNLPIELPEVSGKPSYFIFQFKQNFSYYTEYHSTFLRLPIGCFIHEDILIPVTPEDYDHEVSGKRLHLYWERENLLAQTTLEFIIFFDEPFYPSNYIWAYFVGPILGMLLGGCIVYFWMKRGTQILEEEIEKIYLTKNQELLLRLIDESKGKITQQQLIAITDFTKSKVSRNLTPLEENGLIAKEKWGREFKVSLTKKGQKVAEKLVAEKLQFSEKFSQPDFSKESKNNMEMKKSEDK